MEEQWKQRIIDEKLGGKSNWSDEERLELCRQLDADLEKHLHSMEDNKYTEGWTEENWRQEMADHPLFAPYVQDGNSNPELPINALSEGIAQLKYSAEHNTPSELSQNYKDEGNIHFKLKNYRFAIASFSEALKQQCDDLELNAQLYNNRSAAHFQLGNFRSCLKDCEEAFMLKNSYVKAIRRGADSAAKLNSWQEVINWCERGLVVDSNDQSLLTLKSEAVKQQKLLERNERRRQKETKIKTSSDQKLLSAITNRGIRLGKTGLDKSVTTCLEALESCHPASQESNVHLLENGELVWPVMFLYPEFGDTDLIQEFNETDRFAEHLKAVFGDSVPPAPWDTCNKYKPSNVSIYFEDLDAQSLCLVESSRTLQDVLTDRRYRVIGGTPAFIILVKGSEFAEEFVKKYK